LSGPLYFFSSFNNVSIVSSVYGCQFSWFFKLARSTDEEFFSILTEPNMKISINLVEAQKQLIQLNKGKNLVFKLAYKQLKGVFEIFSQG